jgi:hypothetical protein
MRDPPAPRRYSLHIFNVVLVASPILTIQPSTNWRHFCGGQARMGPLQDTPPAPNCPPSDDIFIAISHSIDILIIVYLTCCILHYYQSAVRYIFAETLPFGTLIKPADRLRRSVCVHCRHLYRTTAISMSMIEAKRSRCEVRRPYDHTTRNP